MHTSSSCTVKVFDIKVSTAYSVRDKSIIECRQFIVRISFCELTNLTFDVKRERYLGNGLSIKRIPSYIGQIIDEDRGYTVPFPDNRWMIFGAPRRDFVGRQEWEIANKIRVLIDALLIYCGENVEPGAQYLCDYNGRDRVNKVSKTYGGVLDDRAMGHRKMNLTSRQVVHLKRLFPLLMNTYNNQFVQIPLTFYREACVPRSRHIPWKIIVYLTISLESIFLESEHNKASELANRVAGFLSQNNQYVDDIYRQVFALYKCRNAIVHDGNQSPIIQVAESNTGAQLRFNITDLTKTGHDVLQRTIRKILCNNILDKQALLSLISQRSVNLQWPRLQSQIVYT